MNLTKLLASEHGLRLPVILAFALLLSSLLSPVNAAEKEFRFQLTPFVGYRFGGTFEDKESDAEFDLNENPSYGLIANFPSRGNIEWEIYYSKQSTEVDLQC